LSHYSLKTTSSQKCSYLQHTQRTPFARPNYLVIFTVCHSEEIRNPLPRQLFFFLRSILFVFQRISSFWTASIKLLELKMEAAIVCTTTIPKTSVTSADDVMEDTFSDWTTATGAQKFVVSCAWLNSIASSKPTSSRLARDKLDARTNHLDMSRWFVRVGFLDCSVESPKLARDVSSLSPTSSRQVRDKLETACFEFVSRKSL
jgi:hypothetical protein